jgi:predicted RNA-binding Zn ribbon-like protein
VARATELREALRALLAAHNGGGSAPAQAAATLDQAAGRARMRLHFHGDGGAALVPEAGGVNGALGRLLAIVHDAIAQGTWRRLKACRDHDCEWAFYDHTKNGSGAWCSMERCGNRAKARAFRDRHAAAAT